MDRKSHISEKLNSVSDKEWGEIIDKLTVFLRFKLKGRVKYGAHSEENLGVDAINFYIEDAIQKLFEHKWDWKFEEYNIIEQLKRIISSSISENVRKEKHKLKDGDKNCEVFKIIPTDPTILATLIEQQDDSDCETDQSLKLFEEILIECSKDDPDLELLVLALQETNDSDEIVRQFGWDKTKLYSLQRKLYRRVRRFSEIKRIKF